MPKTERIPDIPAPRYYANKTKGLSTEAVQQVLDTLPTFDREFVAIVPCEKTNQDPARFVIISRDRT